MLEGEEEDSVGEEGEEESVMTVAVVVLEGEEEWEEDDSESVELPLNDEDSYTGGLYEDEESDDESEDLAY